MCNFNTLGWNGKILKNTYGNKRLPPIILKWIVNRTLVEEIRISNEIEGVVSTRKEINELMSKKNPNKYKRLYGMVNKYKQLTRDNEKLVINLIPSPDSDVYYFQMFASYNSGIKYYSKIS